MFNRFKGAVSLCTYKKDGYAKFSYLKGIFGCSWALRGAPRVTDALCATPADWRGRTNQKDVIFDCFNVAVSHFTKKQVCTNNNAAFCCDFVFNISFILYMICFH